MPSRSRRTTGSSPSTPGSWTGWEPQASDHRVKAFLALPRPWLIAHRGGAGLAPENTLAAFGRGAELGASCLELDVRRTCDGAVVAFHDPDTARTTGEGGAVDGLTLEELRRLDAGFTF